VSNNCPNLKTGKWSVEDSVKVVESKLAFREIMGFHQQGRSGFGLSKPLVISPKGTHNYRIFISDLSEDIERENYLAKATQLHLQGNWAKATQLHLQGNWVRWCDHVKVDLSWKSLLALIYQWKKMKNNLTLCRFLLILSRDVIGTTL